VGLAVLNSRTATLRDCQLTYYEETSFDAAFELAKEWLGISIGTTSNSGTNTNAPTAQHNVIYTMNKKTGECVPAKESSIQKGQTINLGGKGFKVYVDGFLMYDPADKN
jgi:hypothetical protein